MRKFDTVQLKVRVVENTTDTILEGAVSFMEEKLYSSHINPQLLN